MIEKEKDFSADFGEMVFNDSAMKHFLEPDAYAKLKGMLTGVMRLDEGLADSVADGMMKWALSVGATHYTHWFQPLTNITAGKHDSFLDYDANGNVVCSFTGRELQKGEPDASSFPSGGLRATFEARGYTIWDSTSPCFVKDKTLYIPTAFCAYTGEALDRKTPLLRSMQTISKQSLRVLKAIGNTTSSAVMVTVGAEQEYFLVDRAAYEKRLDLKITGRTLFGAKPVKGQELDDHYCGRIRIKVNEFMQKLDHQLWSLGVLSKTKHNEVAPAQHELAPLFSYCNTACDNNQLIMECMRVTAKKQGLACLLHEKPFDGINGSGKHNNWSLSTDDGINLLKPGKNPSENLPFLLFLSAIIKAVDCYSDLIRFTAASAGNDRRLGGNEAPPAIISIFLGQELEDVLKHIADGSANLVKDKCFLNTGAKVLPELKKDDSDRNRTSPVAFTGNKFEFRMIGSSASIAGINYMLNTAVTEALDGFAQRLENASNPQQEVYSIVADTYTQHGRIIFNGNNYSNQWVEEASRRGLNNITNTVDAIKTLIDEKNIALFERYGVFTRAECISRYEIFLETYIKTISIETATMLEMAKCQIIPACISYLGKISLDYNNICKSGIKSESGLKIITKLSATTDKISLATDELENSSNILQGMVDDLQKATYCRDCLVPKMDSLRIVADIAETLIDKECWPFPDYNDLLHRV